MPEPTRPIKLLLVEDDIDVAAGIGDYLSARGVTVDYAYNVRQARERALSEHFDLLVLDVQLPDGDGMQLCRSLKQDHALNTPALFLTAQTSLDHKLQGFAAGAVDYVAKPFEPAELLARVRAITAHVPASGGARLQAGEFSLDLHHRTLLHGATSLPLHAAGFSILRRLFEAWPGSVSRDELCELLWPDETPDSDPLRAHIYHVRRALEERFGVPLIATQRGVGYRIDVQAPQP